MDRHLVDLISMLGHPNAEIRAHAGRVLANIGMPAVHRLAHLCLQGDALSAAEAARVLDVLGEAKSLPTKIIAESSLAVRKRIRTLESLGKVYLLPPLKDLCGEMLTDSDPCVQQGAIQVLRELDRLSLLRASEADTATNQSQLLRAAHSGPAQDPATLLRSDYECIPDNRKPPGFWAAMVRHLRRH
jgi:hypothetical protein